MADRSYDCAHTTYFIGTSSIQLGCRPNLSCAPGIPHFLCQWMVPRLVLTHTHRFLQTTLSFCDCNFNLLSRNCLLQLKLHFWKPALRISLCMCSIFILSPFSLLNNFILIKKYQVNKLRSEV